MKNLKHLLSLCKGEVMISVNPHKSYYETVEEYLNDLRNNNDATPEDIAEMIRLDTLVEITAYPNTPVGSFSIYHYDIDKGINEMISLITK